VRQFRASRTLKKPTGASWIPRRTVATPDSELVSSSRPACPSGHRPSRSADGGRSSSTTSHGWLVEPSQLMKRAATDSAVPVGSMPVAATDACT
jgi:hypothetical protein